MSAPARLGRTLVAMGVIVEDQLRIALHEQQQRPEPLGALLIRLGFVSEATLRDALAHTLGKPSVDLATLLPEADALALVPIGLARRHRVLPLHVDPAERRLVLAAADPDDVLALDALARTLPPGFTLDTRLAGDAEIARAIDEVYGHELSIDGILHELETGEADLRSLAREGREYAQPVVRLVDALLSDAVRRDASDIHFEPEAGFLRIRYRIDGLLRQIRALHRSCWPAMAVRIKVIAGLNIAETRAPQDGRISLTVSGRPVDFRVATQPTIHGENVVLRILDRQKGIVPLERLGLTDAQLQQIRLMIARPEGLLLFTGPTGSGKTTTLYSILTHINREGVNIMTLEDPVEYPVPLIRQTAVSEAAKLDFGNGVRALLRQDPDVILVGEVRDADTARMAFEAAMTGHQVYTTLHTNSALGAIPRLLDLGVLPDILGGNLIGIVAQRLVRRLCPACREAVPAEPFERRLLALFGEADPPPLWRPVGCARCEHRGYRGRLALMEILRIDADLDELVARRAPQRELLRAARQKGFRTLAEDGVRRVLDGATSLEELSRVVDLTDRMA